MLQSCPPKADELEKQVLQGAFLEFSTALDFYPRTLEFKLSLEMERRTMSKDEIKDYWFHIYGFLNFIEKDPSAACEEDIDDYLNQIQGNKKLAKDAIHFLFREIAMSDDI